MPLTPSFRLGFPRRGPVPPARGGGYSSTKSRVAVE